MDRRRKKKQARRTSSYAAAPAITAPCCSDEASSIEWEFISMSEQEEDLIYRMYQLVGDSRWGLIAGRIPGRKEEEIERFWIMRHGDVYAERRRQQQQQQQQMRRERSRSSTSS